MIETITRENSSIDIDLNMEDTYGRAMWHESSSLQLSDFPGYNDSYHNREAINPNSKKVAFMAIASYLNPFK